MHKNFMHRQKSEKLILENELEHATKSKTLKNIYIA